MIPDITVRNVTERNDCAGKKYFYVSAMEEDELYHSQFRLTQAYMFPQEKLALASVAPQDKVRVVYDHHMPEIMVQGEYIFNYADVHNRDPVCRCGVQMVSDGFDLYCPDPYCALTVAARIERLSNTVFGNPVTSSYTRPDGDGYFGVNEYSDHLHYTQPFISINQGLFWGYPGGSVEHTLLTRDFSNLSLLVTDCKGISLDLFLVESAFTGLLEFLGRGFSRMESLNEFYGSMDELINRRDYNSDRQNWLVHGFIKGLAIESLRDEIIVKMMHHERELNVEMDPLISYAYLLTHPRDMVRELDLHQSEASSIFMEVKRRGREMFNIFVNYSNNQQDMIDDFKDLHR